MYCSFADTKPPILLIHGGAGLQPKDEARRIAKNNAISKILLEVWPKLEAGATAVEAVNYAVELLENCTLFNAGVGAALQSDGAARLSASLMDGSRGTFSAVSLVSHITHPSKLASALQGRRNRVLGSLGAQLLARELGIPPASPVTLETATTWLKYLESPVAGSYGTVGAVAIDVDNQLASATSTGGHGADFPERMSDVSTVAGNYASNYAAISATGIGEEIVDSALAARLETRIRDGMRIDKACEITLSEAKARKHNYGWIMLCNNPQELKDSGQCYASWAICYTTEYMAAGLISSEDKSPRTLNLSN